VLVRATLQPWEDCRVELLSQILAVGEDDTTAGAAQSLVSGGGGDDVGVRDRVRVQSGGDEAGEVSHVDHEVGADKVGDSSELGEVELERVGRPTGNDQPGPMLERETLGLLHVDSEVALAHVVGRDVVPVAMES